MKYKVCNDHIDLAIDMYVDDNELAPEIHLIDQEEKLSTVCHFCQNHAIYLVGN